ncbi:MAG TPA: DUF4399 domain-containing protein [Afifellaceae bacterium]|nr:DUF4399 domain-containing protein [Afifellaceae bacterium]
MRTIPLIAAQLLWFAPLSAMSQDAADAMPRTAAPAAAEAYIQSPADGDEVNAPFVVRFGLRGMGVAPAGITADNTGHHHLLIDVDEMPPENLPLPSTDQIRHFGAGQTETELDLPPGEHTLQLVLGDASHIPHSPPVVSERITITVVE